MIVKGHDFPDVTLVGIVAADLSLSVGDYRSSERTFQLLTQAAGRAGRGDKPGEVVIQTYQPEHYAVVHAAKQDYRSFYEEEILYRELMEYPPVCHMLAVLVASGEEQRAKELSGQLSGLLEQQTGEQKQQIRVFGPAPAGIGKVKDIYRFVFYVKCRQYDALVRVKDRLEAYLKAHPLKNETVQFDFDPMNGF